MNPNLLYSAARKIAGLPGGVMYWAVDATITSPGGSVKAKFTNHLDYECNYIDRFTADITVRVGCIVKEFREVCWKHRDNLSVTLSTYPVDPTTGVALPVRKPLLTRYRAFLTDATDPSLTRGSAITSGTYVDGSDDMLVFHMQLVDEGAYKLSRSSAGGIYPLDDHNGMLLQTVIGKVAKATKAVKFLVMYPADETRKHKETTIPHDVKAVRLAHYVQQNEGGVYYHGLGNFIFKGFWYIYPPYNVKRYQKALDTDGEGVLEIYQVPTQQVPGSESTWQLVRTQIFRIICNGAAETQDISIGQQATNGNGVRYIRASRFLNAGVKERGDNTGEINRQTYMAEIRSSERVEGETNAGFSEVRETDNDAHEMSKLAMREGQIFVTVWQNSAAMEYIHPGMPVRVYQDKGGYVSVRDGTVMKIKETWTPATQGMLNRALVRACGLTIFLDRKDIKGQDQ